MVPDGWRKVELSELATFASGGTPSKDNADFWNGDIPWLTAKDLKSLWLRDSLLKLTELGAASGTRVVPANTILVLVRGMTLLKDIPIGITTREVAFNQDIRAIICNDKINPLFLCYYLIAAKPKIRQHVSIAGHGTGRLETDFLKELPILLPPKAEQLAIAQLLSAWDRTIEKLAALVDAKQHHRKVLAQQLLTGKRRFPEFIKSKESICTKYGAVPADWSQLHIRDVAKQVSKKNAKEANLPVLSCTKYHGLVDSLEYFGKRVFSENLSVYKIVKRGQFAYATNHIEEGSIGYQNSHDAALISPMYTVFETDKRQVDDEFLFRLLKTDLYIHIYDVSTSASVDRRGSLRWDGFSAIPIALPSLPEQRKIAEVLSAADAEIANLQKQLERLKKQKQGLMEQLLTGKKRLNAKPKAA